MGRGGFAPFLPPRPACSLAGWHIDNRMVCPPSSREPSREKPPDLRSNSRDGEREKVGLSFSYRNWRQHD